MPHNSVRLTDAEQRVAREWWQYLRGIELLAAGGIGGSSAFTSALVSVTDEAYGAVGDGVADDTAAIQLAIDAAFGTAASPNNGSATLNLGLYFPPGTYLISGASGLVFPPIRGGRIFGAGRFATRIINNDSGANVFTFDGCEYSRIESLHLELTAGAGRCIDFNWDGDSGAGGANLQSNTFFDLYIKGGGYGVDIGRGNFMGSENTFLQCNFEAQSVAGIKASNFNALQNQVLGGNFSDCAIAIYVASGSIPVISNVGFQDSTTADVKIDNSAGNRDTVSIIGCRTESLNFFVADNNALPVFMAGITQQNSSNGTFASLGAQAKVMMIGCASQAGQISGTDVHLTMSKCKFDRATTFNLGWFSVDDYVDITDSTINGGTYIRHRQMYLDSSAGSGNNISLDWGQTQSITDANGTTLVATQSGMCFDNIGATAQATFTLPAAVKNLVYSFVNMDTDGLLIQAVGNDTIRIEGTVGAAAGTASTVTIGDAVTLLAVSSTQWVAIAVTNVAGWTVT